jgi:hypothetical protein
MVCLAEVRLLIGIWREKSVSVHPSEYRSRDGSCHRCINSLLRNWRFYGTNGCPWQVKED